MKKIIEIQEEVKIGNVILEKGDKIEILEESYKKEQEKLSALIKQLSYYMFSSQIDPKTAGLLIAEAINNGLTSYDSNITNYDDWTSEVGKQIARDIKRVFN